MDMLTYLVFMLCSNNLSCASEYYESEGYVCHSYSIIIDDPNVLVPMVKLSKYPLLLRLAEESGTGTLLVFKSYSPSTFDDVVLDSYSESFDRRSQIYLSAIMNFLIEAEAVVCSP